MPSPVLGVGITKVKDHSHLEGGHRSSLSRETCTRMEGSMRCFGRLWEGLLTQTGWSKGMSEESFPRRGGT